MSQSNTLQPNTSWTKGFSLSLLLGWLMTGSSLLHAADIIVSTVPETTDFARDGVTEYRMDVYGDTTNVPADEIVNAEWDVVVPWYINITRAEIPDEVNNPSQNVNDFFYNNLIDNGLNRVDGSFDGGELTDNIGQTQDIFNGPSNISNKLLGSYWFTVDPSAPLGIGNFTMNEVTFFDSTLSNFYQTSDLGSGVTVQNTAFNIIDPPPPKVPVLGTLGGTTLLMALALSGVAILRKRKVSDTWSA